MDADAFAQIINYFLSTPTGVITLVLGAGGVSVLTQISKKLLTLESEKIIMFIFMVISFSASGLEYLLSAHNLPPTFLGVSTAMIMAVATPLYTYAIKPLSILLANVKAYQSQIKAKVADIEQVSAAEVAAIAPATPVVPVIETPVVEQKQNDPIPVASF